MIREADVVERLALIRDRILRAGGRDVRVLGVTKTFDLDVVRIAVRVGCDGIGENYAQELQRKLEGLDPHEQRPEVHFIGQLQTNKVRHLAGCVDVYETVDRASLATEIARRCPGARVLVQVVTADDRGAIDPGKGGCPLAAAPALIEHCAQAGLQVVGLMTVAPTVATPATIRAGFGAVRALVDREGLRVCSMGMSDDLDIAVGEGSTQVRVGSALFGGRPPRP